MDSVINLCMNVIFSLDNKPFFVLNRVKTFSTFVLIRTSYAWTTTKCLIEPIFKIYIVHVLYRGVGVIRMMKIDKKVFRVTRTPL